MQMYKTALVPLDGSELAEVVFNYARELAGRLGIDLILLHVYSPDEAESEPMRRNYIERAAETIKRTSDEAREKAGIKYGDRPVKVTAHLSAGYPPDEILKYAEANEVDLILMATHGRTGIKRWTMGSVADKVLRASKVPIWLVRAGVPEEIVHDKWPTRKILALLDGSEVSEAILPHVEALAKQRNAEQVEVILLTVSEPALLPSYYPATVPLNWEDHVARCRRADEEYLTKVEQRLKNTGLNVRAEVLVGRAADVIVDYVNNNSINLIVMATHGRSGVSRWVFGSVAEKVLLGVTSPILLIRPR